MRRRLLLLAALAAVIVAGCGGSSRPKTPPDQLFVSTRDGDYAIFGADARGEHERRLTKERGDPATPEGLFFQVQPAWSPDGKRIVFASRRDGAEHLFVMQADGSGTHRLTNTKFDDAHPAWSPDGRSIAFTRGSELWVIGPDGSGARRINSDLSDEIDPAWSPDGGRIAFARRAAGETVREIWVMKADGTGERQVTHLQAKSGMPSWSPDGRRLAFASDTRGGHYEIYSIGADGKGPRPETSSSSDTFDPAWHGKELAFSRDGAIWTVDPSGKERQISSGGNDSSPAWNPRPAVSK